MKAQILLTLLLVTTFCKAQIVTIPDVNFKNRLLSATTSNNIASTQIPTSNGVVNNHTKIDTNNDGEIQVSEASLITYLILDSASITNLEGINSFTNLRYLSFNNNQVPTVALNQLVNLQWLLCNNNELTTIDGSVNLAALYELRCENNQITSLNLEGLASFKNLFCQNNQLSSLNIQGTVVEHVDFRFNQITSINLQGLTTLRTFYCGNNQLSSLNLEGLALWQLHCNNNLLTALDLQNINLYILNFSNNFISQVNLQGMTNLSSLLCGNNQLTELDLAGLYNIETLSCPYNQLTALNLQTLTKLSGLTCNNNQLTQLDSQYSTYSADIDCSNNQLTSLFVKNGSNQIYINFANNPNIQYICCDYNDFSLYNSEYDEIIIKLNQYGITNCNVNSYCSFTPGGAFYTITGTNTYDENTDGCDSLDPIFPNLKFNINNGSVYGSFINNASGTTNFPVQAGTFTITPALENPSYFTATPSSATVNFPASISPFIQDFCFAPNGSHPDLEIIILPLDPIVLIASTVRYKIIYKNKGTTTQSGNVNLLFNDPALDLVTAVPTASTQTNNNLTWDFSNLRSFESRTIFVEFETFNPPLYIGGYLDYTATVSSAAIDETPEDNVMEIRQTADVACIYTYVNPIQGNTIPPEMVGRYFHYVIGVENTGNSTAQNIVIKDLIDTAKFDISTLQVLDSSHPCTSKITSTNKVEFIFEDINLPAQTGKNVNALSTNLNRGYVAFKIKTKPTLELGNILSNSANIYFDYNAPDVTNNAITTVANTLGVADIFDSKIDVTLFPNPVKNIVQFNGIENVQRIEIYDFTGRIISSNFVLENSLDLSNFKTGSYIVKIFTEKGILNAKIIKE